MPNKIQTTSAEEVYDRHGEMLKVDFQYLEELHHSIENYLQLDETAREFLYAQITFILRNAKWNIEILNSSLMLVYPQATKIEKDKMTAALFNCISIILKPSIKLLSDEERLHLQNNFDISLEMRYPELTFAINIVMGIPNDTFSRRRRFTIK